MLVEHIKLPKERIAVLIGTKGQTKHEIEALTGTKIEVDGEEGEVEISSKGASFESVQMALSIAKAVGRGFSPQNAKLLADNNYYLDIIDLSDFFGKAEKRLRQKRGRVIGAKGKGRDTIEEMTGVKISVYGKTISIIGTMDGVENARRAVEMLLQGAAHKTVLGFLKKLHAYKEFEID